MTSHEFDGDDSSETNSSFDDDSQHEIIEACRHKEWNEVREWLEDDPSLAWTAKSCTGKGIASYLVQNNRVDLLHYIVDLIRQEPIETQHTLLREVFEKQDDYGRSPVHIATIHDDIQSLQFLLRYCPSGIDILELWEDGYWQPIHLAAVFNSIDVFEYLLRHSPSGIAILDICNVNGEQPLELLNKVTQQYFNEQKIREFGLERELANVHFCVSPLSLSLSLLSLIVKVVIHSIEIQLRQNNI